MACWRGVGAAAEAEVWRGGAVAERRWWWQHGDGAGGAALAMAARRWRWQRGSRAVAIARRQLIAYS